jgi:protein-S-isoprenylcysteine O-methyltransferase Ste14
MIEATKAIWIIGVVTWFVIRYPYARRSKRAAKFRVHNRSLERVLLTLSTCGLGVAPAIYVFGGAPRWANYPLQAWQPWLGAVTFAAALWMFHRSHSDLGRNWSVTLEVRERHTLITEGVYQRTRHPMYSAFWLWAAAQAILLPNWFAGVAGCIGFGTLYFFRVKREEEMMIETFGHDYHEYMRRTGRLVPRIRRS